MSSLSIINKAIDRASGTGIPFYVSPTEVFSVENVEFNSSNGLWFVPRDKVPTFQLHIPKPTPNAWNIKEVRYVETRGDGDLTGYSVLIPSASVTMVKAAKKDGEQIYIFQSSDDYDIPEPPRCGRWILQFWLEEGGANILYYSEEFLTLDV